MVAVYLIPSYFCSVGCEHCYLPLEIRQNRKIMSDDTLRQAAKFIKDFASSVSPDEPVTIIWHGGEPLMNPIKWYEHAEKILRKEIGPFEQGMQTSLLPLNRNHLPFLKKYFPLSLGISLDFSLRTVAGSPEKYQEKFLQKWTLLRSYGLTGAFETVPALKDISRAKEIIRFYQKHDIHYVQFERYSDVAETGHPDMPTHAQHAQFLTEAFQETMRLFKEEHYGLFVRVFISILQGVREGISSGVYGGECQSRLLTITPNGNVFLCPNRASYEPPYTNVAKGFPSLEESVPRLQWILRQHLKNETDKCLSCPYRNWCKGSCPILKRQDESGECAGFKSFIDFVQQFNRDNEQLCADYLEESEKPVY